MKSEIFDGGGSFENLYWSGQDSSRHAPQSTTDQRMEVVDGEDKKVKKQEDKEEDKKNKEQIILSQEGVL
ncbi:MAG TPA: hypothetical protein PL110_19835 [Candidatus Eremiobacteraeota bacterium]|nr:MAG: hypothetical protein BWY64_00477 [bacterium ADurb.Bin363]HPZ10351.1 hypothetical protein [Candidatus Eremiobacteraeota bacterium]